jgi:CubicO group peptidase (beta-lactamase class C family)
MTKPIASIALMMLVEEGRLQIEDPVHRYIPAWKDLRVYQSGTVKTGWQTTAPKRPMQVIDLLRHTAGLTYGFQLNTNVDAAYRSLGIGEIEKGDMTLERMIELLGTLPLEFSPGDWWNYSVATDVVGWLVQVISGQPFEDFVAERIFGPLGMVDTGFHVREGQGHRLATCYQPTKTGGMAVQDQGGDIGLPEGAGLHFRRWWPGVDCGRLSALCRSAAHRRTAARGPQDAGADDGEPPARRERSAAAVEVGLFGSRL